MPLTIPWNLFKKLVNHDLSDSETKFLEDWRDSNELHGLIYSEITSDAHFCELLRQDTWENHSAEWGKLLKKIKQPQSVERKLTPKVYLIGAAAASLMLLIGLGAGLWFAKKQIHNNIPQNTYTYIFSPRGQRTQVVLPDRTKAWLNSETSLKYATDFNGKAREVSVVGEVFFEVTKNPEKPFVVHTSELNVKVYGTSFNIKAYPGEKIVETTLIEGKLSVTPKVAKGKKAEEIYLKPNQRLTYKLPGYVNKSEVGKGSGSGNVVGVSKTEVNPEIELTENVDTQRENSWKAGKLFFKDEQFGDLAIKLERWYDVKIHFADENAKKFRFTGVFDKETVNQAMEALRLSSQQSYQYDMIYRDIYIRKK